MLTVVIMVISILTCQSHISEVFGWFYHWSESASMDSLTDKLTDITSGAYCDTECSFPLTITNIFIITVISIVHMWLAPMCSSIFHDNCRQKIRQKIPLFPDKPPPPWCYMGLRFKIYVYMYCMHRYSVCTWSSNAPCNAIHAMYAMHAMQHAPCGAYNSRLVVGCAYSRWWLL